LDNKKPSGAEYRKRRREAKKAIERERAEGIDDGAGEFGRLGSPPLDNPETALAWVRRYQLTAMYIAATHPLTDALRERLKYVREFGATIGMTAQRSELEELAERLETSLAGAAQAVNAVAKPTAAPRPHTSRGTRSGPRPMVAAPRDSEPEDDRPLRPV
jgi:hypothetical protein